MTFLGFCILFTGLCVLAIIITIIILAKANHDEFAVPSGIAALAFGAIGIISWLVFGFSINDQNVDQKYCESLENRGHTTQFFVYNVFNHECYIKVDNQWMEIRDSPFSRGVK